MRALNAVCRWLHQQGEIASLVKLKPQRLEKRLVRTHDEATMRAIVRYRPKMFPQWRIHALVSTLLDTGCRIEEMLTARSTVFDFDNLLLTVYGKGRKERRVPFSIELRKVLFRFGQFKEREGVTSELMFPAQEGGKLPLEAPRSTAILGHSEISTTMKYLHLLTEDLQRPHQGLSILNRLR